MAVRETMAAIRFLIEHISGVQVQQNDHLEYLDEECKKLEKRLELLELITESRFGS